VDSVCVRGNEPPDSMKARFLSSCTTGGFVRRDQLHEVEVDRSLYVLTYCPIL
jgi:hypothetical protein